MTDGHITNPQDLYKDTWKVLVAGGAGAIVVDTSLYPIDTIKTRLQSSQGFVKAGGFKKIFKGITPIVIYSIPNGAIFFAAYETSKEVLREKNRYFENQLANQMLAGACAEFSSCCFKVPFEVVKVNSQTSIESNMQIIRTIIRKEGPMGMYRGFVSTAIRDIPFALLQMPIWEQLKGYHRIKYKEAADAKWSAFYGSISGAIAGLLTTPLDVAKTRIMCDDTQSNSRYQVPNALKLIWKEGKLKGLFSGGLTRMAWIALGGGLFFGAYEQALIFLN